MFSAFRWTTVTAYIDIGNRLKLVGKYRHERYRHRSNIVHPCPPGNGSY